MGNEHLTKAQAERQAHKIEQYWRVRGHQVATWIERVVTTSASDGKHCYAVRSTLVGGLPMTAVRRRLVPYVVE
jgi:hypothetical protein